MLRRARLITTPAYPIQIVDQNACLQSSQCLIINHWHERHIIWLAHTRSKQFCCPILGQGESLFHQTALLLPRWQVCRKHDRCLTVPPSNNGACLPCMGFHVRKKPRNESTFYLARVHISLKLKWHTGNVRSRKCLPPVCMVITAFALHLLDIGVPKSSKRTVGTLHLCKG